MITKELNRQFSGYYNTPTLWHGALEEIEQLELSEINEPAFTSSIHQQLRLGHLVEQFVDFEFQTHPDISVIDKNIQITHDGVTLGEFDFLIYHKTEHKHIEVSYKFYVYDPSVGANELDHWIGPNRKDSLVQKLRKIKDKQFPLLHHSSAKEKLPLLGNEKVVQEVYFKAQLFLPYGIENIKSSMNPSSIYGDYLNTKQLNGFKQFKFYIPSKHNWLITPHSNVEWSSFSSAMNIIDPSLQAKRSVLIWKKDQQGNLSKSFIVWW